MYISMAIQFMETLRDYMENGIIDDINDKTTAPFASHFLAQQARGALFLPMTIPVCAHSHTVLTNHEHIAEHIFKFYALRDDTYVP